jgi:hypothetical protein
MQPFSLPVAAGSKSSYYLGTPLMQARRSFQHTCASHEQDKQHTVLLFACSSQKGVVRVGLMDAAG